MLVNRRTCTVKKPFIAMVMPRCLAGMVGLVLALGVLPSAAAPLANPACFRTPGVTHCLDGRFRDFWGVYGSLSVFGFPITNQQFELNPDTGQSYETQWFERNRFEYHPENARPFDIQLGRLGAQVLAQQGRDWHHEPNNGLPLGGTCLAFEVTNRLVCGPFLAYYFGHRLGQTGLDPYGSSLALFGLPLTGVKMETNPNGDTVLTQWFERARFEWHPNNPEPYKVLLGLLGTEAHTAAGQQKAR